MVFFAKSRKASPRVNPRLLRTTSNASFSCSSILKCTWLVISLTSVVMVVLQDARGNRSLTPSQADLTTHPIAENYFVEFRQQGA